MQYRLFEFKWDLILQWTILYWKVIRVYIGVGYIVDFVDSRITIIAMFQNQQIAKRKILLSTFHKV